MVSTHLKNISQNGNLPKVGVKIKKYLKPPPSYILCQPMKMKLTGHMFPVAENCCWHVTYRTWRVQVPQSLHIGFFWPFTSLPFGISAIYFDLKVFVPTLVLNHGYTKRGKLYNHKKTLQKARKRKTLLKDHQGFEQNPTSFWFRKGKALKAWMCVLWMYTCM